MVVVGYGYGNLGVSKWVLLLTTASGDLTVFMAFSLFLSLGNCAMCGQVGRPR